MEEKDIEKDDFYNSPRTSIPGRLSVTNTPLTKISHLEGDNDGDGIVDIYQVKSCVGGSSDTRCLKLLVQVIITFAVIAVCLAKIYDDTLDCESSSLYVSLLSLLIGFWLKTAGDKLQ